MWRAVVLLLCSLGLGATGGCRSHDHSRCDQNERLELERQDQPRPRIEARDDVTLPKAPAGRYIARDTHNTVHITPTAVYLGDRLESQLERRRYNLKGAMANWPSHLRQPLRKWVEQHRHENQIRAFGDPRLVVLADRASPMETILLVLVFAGLEGFGNFTAAIDANMPTAHGIHFQLGTRLTVWNNELFCLDEPALWVHINGERGWAASAASRVHFTDIDQLAPMVTTATRKLKTRHAASRCLILSVNGDTQWHAVIAAMAAARGPDCWQGDEPVCLLPMVVLINRPHALVEPSLQTLQVAQTNALHWHKARQTPFPVFKGPR